MDKHLLEMTNDEIDYAVRNFFDSQSVDQLMEIFEEVGLFKDFDRDAVRKRLEEYTLDRTIGINS